VEVTEKGVVQASSLYLLGPEGGVRSLAGFLRAEETLF
jgi:hypothetical protein